METAVLNANLPRLMAVVLQVALLLGLAHYFNLESLAFRKVMALALVGFVVHHLLPLAIRLPFFVLLSLAALVMVVQPANALRLTGVGLALIGMCHLPIHFWCRLTLIAAAVTALVMGRAGWLIEIPGFEAVWPILGSMFMFRLIVYLYDLKNRTAPFSLWRSLAYFFMLPNVCFPMYPLVDYQVFNRTYFDEPTPWRTYQLGIKWMFRGLVHLLLYRAVQQHMSIRADLVVDAGDLVRYVLGTLLLYLQISGQFHLIVGMLHLFGFNLPETHHNYLLSSSFTDFWRRINIYWKDFILKIFFNPIYFRVRPWGPAAAITVATLASFLFSCLLLSYQYFWIRGDFLKPAHDKVFWGGMALLVLANALYEQKYGRRRRLKGRKQSIGSRVAVALKAIGMFCAIATLWCLWHFEGSLGEWLGFMGMIRLMNARQAALIAAGLVGLGVATMLMADGGREYSVGGKRQGDQTSPKKEFPFWRSALATALIIAAVLGTGRLIHRLPVGAEAIAIVGELRRSGLSHGDRARGFHEQLANPQSYNQALWDLYRGTKTTVTWVPVHETAANLRVPDQFHLRELKPLSQITFKGMPFSVNRWGMRDRDYEQAKPAGVYRVAVLGTSNTMGSGVRDDETFENLLEVRLNQEFGGRVYERYEFLNFAVGGYTAWQKLWTFERSLAFEPDAVLWETHMSELPWLVNHLMGILRNEVAIPYPEIAERIQAAGLNARSTDHKMRMTLNQMAPELLTWIMESTRDDCSRRGIPMYVMVLPRLDPVYHDETALARIADLTREAGLPIFDLTAYDRTADRTSLWLSQADDHPNAEGHRLIAQELYRQMLALPEWRAVFGEDQPQE